MIYSLRTTVLKNNMWQLPALDVYANLVVTQPNETTVRVTFPFWSKDNSLFFTNFILPRTILEDASLQQYTEDFAKYPTTSNCANIETTNDDTSLVFNLWKCEDSLLWYYQVKKYQWFEWFQTYIQDAKENNNTNIIDMYKSDVALPWYQKNYVTTSKYPTIFFNSTSKKFSPRIKRSLAWLITQWFYTWEDWKGHIQRNHLLFNVFLSDGESTQQYILTHNPDLEIEKKDLENINVKEIPETIVVSWSKQKKVFYIDTLESDVLDINLSLVDQWQTYSQLILKQSTMWIWSWTITTWSNITKQKDITLSIKNNIYPARIQSQNLQQWLNKFFVEWTYSTTDPKTKQKKTETIRVTDLDLYYLNVPDTLTWAIINPDSRFKVVYVKDWLSIFIVKQFQTILAQSNLQDFFVFIGYDLVGEFRNKLDAKDYDIAIRAFDFWIKQDYSNIFLTDSPNTNPSMYTNERLASYLSSYASESSEENKKWIKFNIDEIYANDVPFVILWQHVEPVYVRDDISFWFSNNKDFYTFRKNLYKDIQLVKHFRPNIVKIFSRSNILDFLEEHLTSSWTY